MTNFQPLTDHEQDLVKWTDEVIRLSNLYGKERKAFGIAKANLDVLLAGKLISMLGTKKNLGIEMAYLLLIAGDDRLVTERVYQEMIHHENNYKALEKMIDAYHSKIMATQSIMRFKLEGEKGGRQ
jgi:hypothetical protein